MNFNVNVNVRVNQQQLNRIEQKVETIMATTVTRKDLDAAIDNLLSVIQSKAAQVATDMQNLEAKVAQAAPDSDFSAEFAKVKQGIDAIGDIDPTAAAAPAPTTNTEAAAAVNPPPPPPAEVTAPVDAAGATPAAPAPAPDATAPADSGTAAPQTPPAS